MFNTTIHKTTVTPVTRVIEKTISPDKVTDMYKDVRQEVEKQILKTFLFNDNKVNGVVVELQPIYENAEQHILIRFTLNGKEEIEKIVRTRETLTRNNAYELLVGIFADKIFKMVAKVAGTKIVGH